MGAGKQGRAVGLSAAPDACATVADAVAADTTIWHGGLAQQTHTAGLEQGQAGPLALHAHTPTSIRPPPHSSQALC